MHLNGYMATLRFALTDLSYFPEDVPVRRLGV